MSQYNVPNKSQGQKWSAAEHNAMKISLNSKVDILTVDVVGDNVTEIISDEIVGRSVICILIGASSYTKDFFDVNEDAIQTKNELSFSDGDHLVIFLGN